ncbi:MAG: VanW family protein [Clostridia bacterium]|nr:VanW family protein [Clostridia bacterium]
MKKIKKRKLIITFSVAAIILLSVLSVIFNGGKAFAELPFYDAKNTVFVLRAEFTTDYSTSSPERKHNVFIAAKSLNGAFIDVNAEFSFNKRVGARTEQRGYKSAKIIVNGKFTDGVGGGVCQVSTTLYNAALLAGLKITEKHDHTLAVSYVEPSFDAMVSGGSDLKFANTTKSPIYIKTSADGNKLTVKIYGEKQTQKITRKSVIVGRVEPNFEKVNDEKGEYPELTVGQEKVISAGKNGIKSEGYLVKSVNGKIVSERIRRDYYAPIPGLIVVGTAIKPQTENGLVLAIM